MRRALEQKGGGGKGHMQTLSHRSGKTFLFRNMRKDKHSFPSFFLSEKNVSTISRVAKKVRELPNNLKIKLIFQKNIFLQFFNGKISLPLFILFYFLICGETKVHNVHAILHIGRLERGG